MSILFVSAQPQPPAIDGPHNEKAAPTIIFKHSAPRDNSNWSQLWTRLKPFFWEEPEFSLMGEHKLEDKGRRFPRLPTFYKDNGGGCFHTLIVGQLSGVGGSSICRNNCGGVSQAFPIPILWQWGLNTWSHWRHSWNSKYWRFLADSSWFVTLDVFKIMCKGSLMIWVFVKQWALCCST